MQLDDNEIYALLKMKRMLKSANTPVPAFLLWAADRFVNVHDESPNVDFVQTLRERALQIQEIAMLLDCDRGTT